MKVSKREVKGWGSRRGPWSFRVGISYSEVRPGVWEPTKQVDFLTFSQFLFLTFSHSLNRFLFRINSSALFEIGTLHPAVAKPVTMEVELCLRLQART